MSGTHAELYCEDLAELLAACEQAEPDDAMLESIESHVAGCSTCRAAEMLLARSIAELERQNEDELRQEFEQRLVDYYCKSSENGSQPTNGDQRP